MRPSRKSILGLMGLGGLLWCLAWPEIGGITPLAFVAWVPVLLGMELVQQRAGAARVRVVPYIYLAAFTWILGCTWWFVLVSEPIATRLLSVGGPVLINALLMTIPWWFRHRVRRCLGTLWSDLALVAAWLTYERLHHAWDLQWPWLCMGNVFGGRPAWVQWYEVTGMLGGSLWLWLVNLVVFRIIMAHRAGQPVRLHLVATCVALGVPLVVSLWRFHTYAERGPAMGVVAVQPNLDPYSVKFHTAPLEQLDRMLDLAGTGMDTTVKLVLLPETALQESSTVDPRSTPPTFIGLWENDLAASRSAQRIKAWQSQYPQVAVLAGMSSYQLLAPTAEPPIYARPLPGTDHFFTASNAALFIGTDGVPRYYRKSKLVASVEQMPFERVLGGLDELAIDLGGTTGSLAPQQERTVFHDARARLAIAPAICYESVFGEHVAGHVRNGANLIAVITNDGWWGTSPGYRQHLTFSSLRAIETRRAVARSANTGISCAFDQRGVMHDPTEWWVADAVRLSVRLNDRITFYVRYGDLIGRIALVITLALLCAAVVLPWWCRKRPRRTQNRGTRRAMAPSGPSKRTT